MFSVINLIEDGFVYYNSDDCFVVCNDKYCDYYGGVFKFFMMGIRFEDIFRLGVLCGYYVEVIGKEEEWL